MKNQNIAKIDNQLVFKAHYSLSMNEQKLILFLISNIDPKARKDFETQKVKIKDIENLFSVKGKRWGSIYERVDIMCNNITDKKITLPKGFIVDGEEIKMNRYIQWFSDIEPYMDEDGEIALKFQFAKPLKGFLLQLKEYVKINMLEVMPLRSKYAIRMYQVLKAERDRTKKFKNRTSLIFGIDELKAMLEVGSKYKVLKDFRRNVLDTIKNEINKYSREIVIDYEYLKTRRKVTGIEFYITDYKPKTEEKKDFKNYVPTTEDIEKLTRGQLGAYNKLIEFGVYAGIVYRQLLPTIKGANMSGLEDLFIEQAILVFKNKEKPKKGVKSVGAFVNWWTDKKVFSIDGGGVFFQITDKVNEIKKKMSQEQLDNREMAKDMTNGEFEKWYREKNKQTQEA